MLKFSSYNPSPEENEEINNMIKNIGKKKCIFYI